MISIAVASPKGGVGKTTVALNLALALAERGLRTLLVDVDPQGGIGHALGRGDRELAGLADLIAGDIGEADTIVPTKLPALSLLPRGRLDPVDVPDFEATLSTMLPGLLSRIGTTFDRIIVDTPSGLGQATRTALQVADFVLVPVQAEPLALRSLQHMLRVVVHVQQHENARLRLGGIVATMADRANEPSQEVLYALWYGIEGVLETVIPRVDVFAEASRRGVPVGYLAGPPSPEARRFDMLAAELELRIAAALPEVEHAHRPARSLL